MGSFLLLLGWQNMEVRETGNMFRLHSFFWKKLESGKEAHDIFGFKSSDWISKKTGVLGF